MLEKYVTGTGQNILVHARKSCKGEYCVIHNPSNHHMVNYPTHWRQDRAIMERICPHGVGHPDPDDVAYAKSVLDKKGFKYYTIHGCDGCCNPIHTWRK